MERAWPSNVTVWVWLLTLLVLGIAAAYLPVGQGLALSLVFAAALFKAVLVARHYMHLRAEHVLIYVIIAIPLMLAIGFALSLIPDVITNHGGPPAP